jgi:hypothetical protein
LCRGCGVLRDKNGSFVEKLQKAEKAKALKRHESDQSAVARKREADEGKRKEKLFGEIGILEDGKTKEGALKNWRENRDPSLAEAKQQGVESARKETPSGAKEISAAIGEGYEVVLSFAGEDREYVEKVAEYLKQNNVAVFYDRYEEVSLWGKELTEFFDRVYGGSARYCVMFISKHYADKVWTTLERRSALTKAVQEKAEYILPARFDDTELPGIRRTIGYVDLRRKTPQDLGKMVMQKLGKLKQEERAPSEFIEPKKLEEKSGVGEKQEKPLSGEEARPKQVAKTTKLNEYQEFREVLYSNGEQLSRSVYLIFEKLGFDVQWKGEEGRHDMELDLHGTLGIVEVKGSKGPANSSDLRQLLDYYMEAAESHRDVKGIFVVNHFCAVDPTERGQPFTSGAIRIAELNNFCLMTTIDLFDLLDKSLGKTAEINELVLRTKGRMTT